MLQNLIATYGPLALGIIALGFVAYGISGLFASDRVERRLRGDQSGEAVAHPSESLVKGEGPLQSYEEFLTPDDPGRVAKLRERLDRAGYFSPAAVRVYFACKWGLSLGGTLAFAILLFAILGTLSGPAPLAALLVGALLSYFATDFWIGRKAAYRKIAVEDAFPDALDLMLVCIEAGHSLDQAIGRVARELRRSSEILGEELSIVVAELRAGKDRSRVLTDFAKRSNVDDVAAFATVIKQADKFGVSIADTLRVYAREMRDKRYMRAEEKANLMPLKLAMGAIAFTIPPVMLIFVGPAIITIIREMARAGQGG
ncbi:MAG: type II secretion system F family protein [Alphaproteobacteria bacterium]|nr:type II secretion system F family protein [Alphaproteobacteria bacterium]